MSNKTNIPIRFSVYSDSLRNSKKGRKTQITNENIVYTFNNNRVAIVSGNRTFSNFKRS